MKVLVLRSAGERGAAVEQDYLQEFDTLYADRVLGNLRSEASFCSVCGPDCTACRKPYARLLGDDIAGIIDLPAVLPYVLEEPWQYVPEKVPAHDVLLAVNIHEQVLLEVLERCPGWGTAGVVVPLEEPHWISGSARSQAKSICARNGIEIDFPKPFCDFRPEQGTVLADFRNHFHIGRPEVELTVEDGVITAADVRVSAACGATYCIARWLVGRRLSDNIEIEVISKRLHSYPCTASMERDPELGGDTTMHVAGHAHYEILAPHRAINEGADAGMIMSPVGIMVARPRSARENMDNIERARELVLDTLSESGSTSLQELRQSKKTSPAAISSAVLLLKKEGCITVKDGLIKRR